MRMRLVLDWAVFPPDRVDAEQRQNVQAMAIRHLLSTAPKWCEIAIRTTDFFVGVPTWRRDGKGKASNKDVPYVGEMFDLACEGGHDFGAILNSDVFVMDHFWVKLEALVNDGADAIIGHRTDVTNSEFLRLRRYNFRRAAHTRGRKVSTTWSTDMIALRPSVWHEHRLKMLDEMVIGEPFWDTCAIWWLADLHDRLGLHTERMRQSELVHQVHGGGWCFESRYARRAAKMFYEAFPHVKETREGPGFEIYEKGVPPCSEQTSPSSTSET
jgi:hypothetical protein